MKRWIKLLTAGILLLQLTACNSSQSASDFYKEGMKNYKAGDYPKAEENLLQAVTKNPDKAEYYIDYGLILIHNSKYSDALIQFDKAILNKNNQIVKENNKRAHRGKGIAYFEAADYKNAVKEFQAAVSIKALESLNMDINQYLADSMVRAQMYGDAVTVYTKLIEERKTDASFYGRRANAYACLGDQDKALEDYNKAIELENSNFDYYFGKYYLLLAAEKESEASQTLSDALAIKTKTQKDYYNVAKIHFLLGDYDSAITEFGEAIANGFLEGNYYLGQIYESKKDIENAIYYYKQYIENSGNLKSAAAYANLSSCYLNSGDYEQALDYISKGLEKNDTSSNQQLLYNQVVAYEKKADYEKALENARKYVEMYPNDKKMAKEVQFLETRVK